MSLLGKSAKCIVTQFMIREYCKILFLRNVALCVAKLVLWFFLAVTVALFIFFTILHCDGWNVKFCKFCFRRVARDHLEKLYSC